jgi:hypothetical protein
VTTPNVISEISITNLALSRAGSSQTISSFNDGSNEANQGAIWYPQDRDATLCDWPWEWAEVYTPLAEVAGPETTGQRANAVWFRSYRYPSDCLKMKRVVRTPWPLPPTFPPPTPGITTINYGWCEPWRRAVGDAVPISYGMSNDSTGRLIVTDAGGQNGITAVYTQAVADPTQFSADFADMLAWRLGGDLAFALGRDQKKRDVCMKAYFEIRGSARAADANQVQSDIPRVGYQSQTVRARWRR